jgi:hypothetical protein
MKTNIFWEVKQHNLTNLLEELAASIFRIEVCAKCGSDIGKYTKTGSVDRETVDSETNV